MRSVYFNKQKHGRIKNFSRKFITLTTATLFVATTFAGAAPLLFAGTANAVSTGDVLITSAMPNPTGTDSHGEYIVIKNRTPYSFSLNGWTISDNAGSHTLSGTIAAGASYKICRDTSASSTATGCDTEWSGMDLVNSGDVITLSDGSVTIDQVSYSSSSEGVENTFSPTPGYEFWNIAKLGFTGYPTTAETGNWYGFTGAITQTKPTTDKVQIRVTLEPGTTKNDFTLEQKVGGSWQPVVFPSNAISIGPNTGMAVTTASSQFRIQFNKAGTFSAVAELNDMTTGDVRDNVKLTTDVTAPAQAPVIGATTPSDSTGMVYKSAGHYVISAVVTDQDKDIKNVKWSLNGPGSFTRNSDHTNPHFVKTGSSNGGESETWSADYNLANLPLGNYTITFTAADNAGNNAASKTVHVTLAEKPLNIVKVDPYFRPYSKVDKPYVTNIIGVDTTFEDYHNVSSFEVQLLKDGNVLATNTATTSRLSEINSNNGSKITRSSPFYLPVNTPSTVDWIHDGHQFTQDEQPDTVRVVIKDASGTHDKTVPLTNLSYHGESYQSVVKPIITSVTPNKGSVIHGNNQRIDINIYNPETVKSGSLMLNKLPSDNSNPSNGARTNFPLRHDSNGWYAMVNTKALQGDGKYLFKVEAHGSHTPWGYYGNNSAWYSHSYYFTVDNTIPSMQNLKFYVKNSAGNYVPSNFVKAGDQARVEVEATDATSGVKKVEFRIQDANTGAYVAPRVYEATPAHGDTYRYDFTVPTDGKYYNTHDPITTATNGLKFWARAYDNAGNYGNGTNTNGLSGNFTYDNTAPQVSDIVLNGKSVTSPRDHNCGPTHFYLVSGKVDLSATITDSSSGVANAKYKIRKVNAGGCTQTGIYQSGTVSMDNSSGNQWVTLPGDKLDTNDVPVDGTYTIMMTVKDKTGNTVTKYVDINVDNTKPTVKNVKLYVNGHETTLVKSGDVVTVKADIDGTGSDVAKVQLSAAGRSWPDKWRLVQSPTNSPKVDMTQVSGTATSGTWKYTFTVPPHYHSWAGDNPIDQGFDRNAVAVQATDAAGNQVTSGNNFFTIDNTRPSVTIDNPSNGDILNTNNFTVNGTTSDANGIASVTYKVTKISRIGGSYLANVANGTPTGVNNWSFNVNGVSDGFYRLKVTVFDNAGNRHIKYNDIQVDTTPPTVTVNGYTGTSTTPTITGTTSDASDIVTVDGNSATVSATPNGSGTYDWSYTPSTPFALGSTTITAVSTDQAGNSSSQTAIVTVTAPQQPNNNSSNNGGNNTGGNTGNAGPALLIQGGGAPVGAFGAPVGVFGGVAGGPAGGGAPGAVLGAQTNTPNTPNNKNDNKDNGHVKGVNVTNANEKKDQCTTFLGLCWYYWIPIVIVVLGILYYLYNRHNKSQGSTA